MTRKKHTVSNDVSVFPKTRVDIWLVLSSGDIFIKSLSPQIDRISISDLTITASDITEAIKIIEEEWKILCAPDNLDHIYTPDGEKTKSNGYVLHTTLDDVKMKLITKSSTDRFVKYDHIEEKIKSYSKEVGFEGAFSGLLSWAKNTFRYIS